MSEYEKFKKQMQKENPDVYLEEIDAAWRKKQDSETQTGGAILNNIRKDIQESSDNDRFEDNTPGIKRQATKTVERNMSDIISEKLVQLKDLATMEVMMDTHVRMQHRMDSIKKISSANSLKIRGQFKTIAQQIHISDLQGKKISNDEAEITFGVYAVDKKGNKKEFKNYSYEEIEEVDGSTRMKKKHLSSEYRIKYEIKETIRTGKAITREKVKIDIWGDQ